MSVNKKLIRNTVIAAVALCALAAGYWFAVKWQPSGGNDAADAETFPLMSVKTEDAAKIEFKNENGAFSLVRTGEGDKAKWSIPEREGVEFSQSMIESTVSAICSLNADKEIADSAENSAEYGFSSPKAEVSVTTKDGTEKTLVLGDKMVVDTSYYIMEKGGGKIYAVSEYNADALLKQPNDFREKTLATIDAQSLKRFAISRGGQKVVEIVNSDGADDKSSATMSSLRMTYPYSESVNTEKFSKITEVFTSVSVTDFVSDNPADAEKYGINSGVKVEIEDGTAAHTLTFGGADENGNVYTMYNDKGFIFTTSPKMLDAVSGVKPFDLMERFAHIYNIDNVESITVKANGKTHTLSMSRSGSGDDVKTTYKMDGKDSEENAFKGMYQAIIGLTVTDEVSGAESGEKFCEITFKMTDGKSNAAVYYTHDERNLRVTRPDGKSFLILKKYVSGMLETLEKFAENPKQRPADV